MVQVPLTRVTTLKDINPESISDSNHFFSNKEEDLKIAINAYVKKSTELI